MTFIKFPGGHINKGVPMVSISASGRISFNRLTKYKYDLRIGAGADLLYNAESHLIAIDPAEPDNSAAVIRQSADGGVYVSGSNFLHYFDIFDEVIQNKFFCNLEGSRIIIDLNKARPYGRLPKQSLVDYKTLEGQEA